VWGGRAVWYDLPCQYLDRRILSRVQDFSVHENPQHVDSQLKTKGDNDPLDICELSGVPRKTGDVIAVKILGVYAMIDAGETDWKILAIDVNDPLAAKVNCHSDIPKEITDVVFHFLRDYKIPDGAPPNSFGFNNELKDRDLAPKVIEETNHQWQDLVSGKIDKNGGISITALTAGQQLNPEAANEIIVNQFKSYLSSKI